MLKGIAASEGIGVGSVIVLHEPDLSYDPVVHGTPEEELTRLRNAVKVFRHKTITRVEEIRARGKKDAADILAAHEMLASDPEVEAQARHYIQQGMCAEAALEQTCDMFADLFSASDDAFTRQRAADVYDVKSGVLSVLLGKRERDLTSVAEGSVLVARDIMPSTVAMLDSSRIKGIVCEVGGLTSHIALLAQSLNIPAVLSVAEATTFLEDGMKVIVNGSLGEVMPSPDSAMMYRAKKMNEYKTLESASLLRFVGKKTCTSCGREYTLAGNILTPPEAAKVEEQDGEGVGLFRTEFLFMDAVTPPTEDEQFEAYKSAVCAMKGKPVVIRTLDIGGDKDIPCLGMQRECNPFMGLRAIRFCLQREDVYRTQLRALIRASAFGDVRILVPLITCVDEFMQVRELVKRYMDEFTREGVAFNPNLQIGAMIETPAAVLMADALADCADFLSIGTNDLIGYTMAVDRGNDKVRYLYSAYNPAVLRAIKHTINVAHQRNDTPVGMCGEAAADPLLTPLWIAFGLDVYSVVPQAILSTRKAIADWSVEDACEVAERVMEASTASQAHELLLEAARANETKVRPKFTNL